MRGTDLDHAATRFGIGRHEGMRRDVFGPRHSRDG